MSSRLLMFNVIGVPNLCMHVSKRLFATGHVSSSQISMLSFVRWNATDISERVDREIEGMGEASAFD